VESEEERHTGWEAERMQRTQQESVIRCVVETGLGLCGASTCVDNWGAFALSWSEAVLANPLPERRALCVALESGERRAGGQRAADAGRWTAFGAFWSCCVCVTPREPCVRSVFRRVSSFLSVWQWLCCAADS